MNLAERLKYLRERKSIKSQKEFCEITDIKGYRLTDMEAGNAKSIKPEEAVSIQEKLHISGWWLFSGEGDIDDVIGKSKTHIEQTSPYEDALQSLLEGAEDRLLAPNHQPDSPAMTEINYYPNTNTSAGYGATNGDEEPDKLMVSESFLSSMFNLDSFDGLDVIHVVGDSMEPLIKHGDAILIKRTHEAKNNQVVIARIGDEYYVKRLVKNPMTDGVRLTSENDFYPNIDIDASRMGELEIVGVLVGKYRPFEVL